MAGVGLDAMGGSGCRRTPTKHLPIYAFCNCVRTDGGYWQQVERFLIEHAGVRPSHGICPECAYKLERS